MVRCNISATGPTTTPRPRRCWTRRSPGCPRSRTCATRSGTRRFPPSTRPRRRSAFWLATLGGPHAWVWRGMALAAELGAAAALAHWLRRTGRDPRAVLLWLFCPLPALEAAVGGHVDTLGVLGLTAAGALLAGAGALVAPAVARRSALLGGALFSLAVGTKLFPLVALPRLGRFALVGCLAASRRAGVALPGRHARRGARHLRPSLARQRRPLRAAGVRVRAGLATGRAARRSSGRSGPRSGGAWWGRRGRASGRRGSWRPSGPTKRPLPRRSWCPG